MILIGNWKPTNRALVNMTIMKISGKFGRLKLKRGKGNHPNRLEASHKFHICHKGHMQHLPDQGMINQRANKSLKLVHK